MTRLLSDHRYSFPSAFWSWEWGPPELCVRPDVGVIIILPERIPDSLAVDLRFDWTYSRTRYFFGSRAPSPESSAGQWLVQFVM